MGCSPSGIGAPARRPALRLNVGLCPSKGARRAGVEDSLLQHRMTCWSIGMRASDDLSVKRAADPSPWAPRRSWAEP